MYNYIIIHNCVGCFIIYSVFTVIDYISFINIITNFNNLCIILEKRRYYRDILFTINRDSDITTIAQL